MRAWLAAVSDQHKRRLLNAKDKHGFTAVHYAARFNRFKIMQLLLLHEAGKYGFAPGNYPRRPCTRRLRKGLCVIYAWTSGDETNTI